MKSGHTSVLYEESLKALCVRPQDVVLDATVGGAGHFRGLLSSLSNDGVLIGIDEDANAIERAREVVAEDRRSDRPVVHLMEDNFRNIGHVLERLGISHIDKALFDLGWSGFQLSDGKGFSFQADEPLLMTYGNPEVHGSAAELVNTMPEEELAKLIFIYGEERFARHIAKAICRARSTARILSTQDLVAAINAGVPAWYRTRRTHPATKTFQALRIAVNDELGALEEGLRGAIQHLGAGGRIAVITFHSIEDRIVKSIFRDAVAEGTGSVVNKKVITPSYEELKLNPRARSAKLRIFESNERDEPVSALPHELMYA